MDSSFLAGKSNDPPRHDEMGTLAQTIEALSIFAACLLVLIHVVRFTNLQLSDWTTLLALLLALPAADFVSGLVHWTADTWGSEQWPLIGRRFLRPFRLHHINPQDLLRRNFVDTNGDVAMLAVPALVAALFNPLDSIGGRFVTVFIVAFCFFSLPTNQIHQWAHMTNPPKLVRLLQRYKLVLGPQHHQAHHDAPFATNYCIVSGWCNRPLASIDFFRRVERGVSLITGLQPRAEEQATEALEEAHDTVHL